MKKLDKNMLITIERQMFNRARDIDLAVYNVLFSDMEKDIVVDALSMYQNPDGGFGHGLEADNLNPNSSSYQTIEALDILKLVGYNKTNLTAYSKKMVDNSFKYLFKNAPKAGKYWLFADPLNNNYACAVWHKYHENQNYNSFTAKVLALTFHFLNENHKYYTFSLKMLSEIINDFLCKQIVEKIDIVFYKALYNEINKFDINNINDFREKLLKDSKNLMCKNPEEFSGLYPNLPLELFDNYTNDNEVDQLIDANLDFLISNLPAHGLWEANWRWKNDYPEEESALLKWMGTITYRNLNVLNKFKRI